MKVIKIVKSFRGGSITHHLVLFDDSHSEDGITSMVEDWCDSDSSGSAYGYQYKWEFVVDEVSINDILKDKIKVINQEINRLILERDEITKLIK
jgi:hypothetical protein